MHKVIGIYLIVEKTQENSTEKLWYIEIMKIGLSQNHK